LFIFASAALTAVAVTILTLEALAAKEDRTAVITAHNLTRAETDARFAGYVKYGSFGRFRHGREFGSVESQATPFFNRDVLVSIAVFDLDAGPVTIELPDPKGRFMSLVTLNQDGIEQALGYDKGQFALSRTRFGTRYVSAAVRFAVQSERADDVDQVHALQNAVAVVQPGGPGRIDMPGWTSPRSSGTDERVVTLSSTVWAAAVSRAVGRGNQATTSVAAIGPYPDTDTLDLEVVPSRNNTTTIYKLVLKDVPVDGFWSVSLYTAQGYFKRNPLNAYNVTSTSGKADSDGSITIQFGGCDGRAPNCLPTVPEWNYVVRLYRPREAILTGAWTLPGAMPMN
jgi:hypothetical protein